VKSYASIVLAKQNRAERVSKFETWLKILPSCDCGCRQVKIKAGGLKADCQKCMRVYTWEDFKKAQIQPTPIQKGLVAKLKERIKEKQDFFIGYGRAFVENAKDETKT
jgi:hypothetical protein